MESLLKTSLLFLFAILPFILCNEHACKLRRVLVETGAKDAYYKPAVVWVNRCSGTVDYVERSTSCAATEWDDIEVELSTGNADNVRAPFKTENHTKCEMRCSCKIRGQKCDNKHSNGERKYIFDCPRETEWNIDTCKCETKIENEVSINKCKATQNDDDTVSVSVTMFVVALAIELVIVLIVIFLIMDACKYRNDSGGVLHKTAEFVRAVSTRPREDHVTLKRDRMDTGSASFLNYSTVKIDKV